MLWWNLALLPILALSSPTPRQRRQSSPNLLSDLDTIQQYWGQITPYADNADNYFGVQDVGLPDGCQVEQAHLLERIASPPVTLTMVSMTKTLPPKSSTGLNRTMAPALQAHLAFSIHINICSAKVTWSAEGPSNLSRLASLSGNGTVASSSMQPQDN